MKFADLAVLGTETTSPRRGRFRARITTDAAPPAAGALAMDEGPSVACSVVDSTEEQGQWVSTIVAGAGRWDRPIDALHFAGPLPLAEVLRAVAATVGETIDTSQILGDVPHYVLPAGPAAAVLDAVAWHVSDAGTTVAGAPRVGTLRPDALVSSVDLQNGIIRGTAPGLLLSGDTVSQTVGTITKSYTLLDVWQSGDGAFVARVRGPSVRDALRALTRPATITPLEPYSATGDLLTGGADGLPSAIRGAPRWFGLGHTAELAPATPVLIAFADGDRSRPTVVAAAPSPMPIALRWDASASVRFAAPRMQVGPTGASPVALAPGVVAALTALATALEAQSVALAATTVAPVLGADLAVIFAAISKVLTASMAATPIPSTALGAD